MRGQILKANAELGVLFGFAIVCMEKGQPYVDLQNEHAPEQAMLKASLKYAQGERRAKLQHADGNVFDGQVVFAFPLTGEIAKAMGIVTERTGLIVGLKPDDPMTLLLHKAGLLTGFSIGGRYTRVNEVEMEVSE
jgi:hypothetical protein